MLDQTKRAKYPFFSLCFNSPSCEWQKLGEANEGNPPPIDALATFNAREAVAWVTYLMISSSRTYRTPSIHTYIAIFEHGGQNYLLHG